jgi:hypothetical protein
LIIARISLSVRIDGGLFVGEVKVHDPHGGVNFSRRVGAIETAILTRYRQVVVTPPIPSRLSRELQVMVGANAGSDDGATVSGIADRPGIGVPPCPWLSL